MYIIERGREAEGGEGGQGAFRMAKELTGTPWSCVLPAHHPTRDRPDLTSIHRLPNRPRSPILKAQRGLLIIPVQWPFDLKASSSARSPQQGVKASTTIWLSDSPRRSLTSVPEPLLSVPMRSAAQGTRVLQVQAV